MSLFRTLPVRVAFACAALAFVLGPDALVRGGDPAPTDRPNAIPITEGLAIGNVGWSARWPVHLDPIEARLVAGTFAWPRAGDVVESSDGAQKPWTPVRAHSKGAFSEGLEAGGYLAARVRSETDRVALLAASGHALAYVNGEPRPGDPYGTGWLALPVRLRAGDNELLFRLGNGPLVARLEAPSAPAYVAVADATLPDLDASLPEKDGRREALFAVVVVNAREAPLRLRSADGGGVTAGWDAEAPLEVPALSLRKVPLVFSWPAGYPLGNLGVSFVLHADGLDLPGLAAFAAATPPGVCRVTFRSAIDGSVQTYAVRRPAPAEGARGALVLSLHGASVEAAGQANAYAPKSWATLVCPTNRRPFGFDWEDWGRWDALEALSHELARGATDPSRVCLTGHSMGGHGTWQLGVHFPDLFAAIGPSAGWISFGTYHGGAPTGGTDPIEAMFRRAASPSDTAALVSNLATKGVYVLHGDADDNVPVSEARAMVERLRPIVPDLHVHEEKGAGHWWDASDAPGADCVDWAPMFDLFARRRLPAMEEVREVDFATAGCDVASRCRWVEIVAQERARVASRVRLRSDPGRPRVAGTTENVARLAIDVRAFAGEGPREVELDGRRVEGTPAALAAPVLRLAKGPAGWALDGGADGPRKTPERCGPFKDAFRRRFCLVPGTRGTPRESAWALAKARYDAETWYYRGNGSVDVLPDEAFLARPARETADRDVVLYGHREMNAAWEPLLGAGPVDVRRGVVTIGDRSVKGDDLACLFVRPRPGPDRACVAVVAGTGTAGLLLCDRMPYWTSGVAFPDVTVMSTEALTKGAPGVRVAGFFGPDWSVGGGEFAWR